MAPGFVTWLTELMAIGGKGQEEDQTGEQPKRSRAELDLEAPRGHRGECAAKKAEGEAFLPL